jgi:hypothetical protein
VFEHVAATNLHTRASHDERLAFWINAYNTLVRKGIVALGLQHSVWEVSDFFDRISVHVGDLLFSANEIEHGILRGNRPHPLSTMVPFPPGDPRRPWVIDPPDPRVHFAISCGARSCPPVRLYEADQLDQQLGAATRAFVNREVTLDHETLVASEIFRWFGSDFDGWPGGLAGFLVRYLEDGPVRQAVRSRGLDRLTWRPYDWRLSPVQAEGGVAE